MQADNDPKRWLRRARKAPIFDPTSCGARVDHGRDVLEQILRHRGSMLLVDRMVAVDPVAKRAVGERRVDPADPVFEGHFPGEPVYPGFLQLEMLGQLGVALRHFVDHGSTELAPNARPAEIRLLWVHGAIFLSEVLPGDDLLLLAQHLEYSGMTLLGVSQLVNRTRGDRIVSACVMEALYTPPTP